MCKELLTAVQDLIVDKDDAWMISDGWKYLFKYNMQEQRMETVIAFPETVGTDYNAFSQIVKVENEIYLIPLTAKNIYYCDILKEQMYKLDVSFIPLPEIKNMNAIVCDKFIYCINRFPDLVIRIDTVTKKIEVFDANINGCIDEDNERVVYRSYKEPCMNHEKIYWTNYSNMLIEFDTRELEFSVKYMEGLHLENVARIESAGFKLRDWIVGVKIFEGIMFLFSMEGKVYQYDDSAREIQGELFGNYVKCSSMDKLISPVFYSLISIERNLYFISSYKNDCIRYDGISKQFGKTLYSYTKEWEGNRRSYTFCKVVNEKQIILYSYYESCFYLLDVEKDFVKQIFLKLPVLDKALVNQHLSFAEKLARYMGIRDNLDILIAKMLRTSNSDDNRIKQSINKNVGEKVYESII